jgi:hypothetical protein
MSRWSRTENSLKGAIKKKISSGPLNNTVRIAGPKPKKKAMTIVLIWKKNKGNEPSRMG